MNRKQQNQAFRRRSLKKLQKNIHRNKISATTTAPRVTSKSGWETAHEILGAVLGVVLAVAIFASILPDKTDVFDLDKFTDLGGRSNIPTALAAVRQDGHELGSGHGIFMGNVKRDAVVVFYFSNKGDLQRLEAQPEKFGSIAQLEELVKEGDYSEPYVIRDSKGKNWKVDLKKISAEEFKIETGRDRAPI